MINKDVFHVMTIDEFMDKYNIFIEKNEEKETESEITTVDNSTIVVKDEEKETEPEITTINNSTIVVNDEEKQEEYISEDYYYPSKNIEDEQISESYEEEVEEEKLDASFDEEIEDEELEDEIIIEDEDNFINRAGEKLAKRNYLGIKIGAGLLGLLVAGTIFACCHKKKTGEIKNSNLPTTTTTTTTLEDENTIDDTLYGPTLSSTDQTESTEFTANNDLYNDYTFAELLNVTLSDTQKDSMINLSASLNAFNGTFANAYLENANNIRAALSFDEMVALQQAYNDYSVEDVRAYFNGTVINAEDMSNAYKDASLQLMGAYVIENSQNPVDMSNLINSDEGKEFYARYHNMFLAAKEATGEEQIELVNEFYAAVKEDFPITEEERTEGISHADSRNSLKDYQLAVTPMIAAAEIIFQNLEVDNTLDDTSIDFINDIGLCNHADDKFERIETIMLGAYEDNENPLYEQYRSSIIKDLTDRNEYVIDDEHRELANLYLFQSIVNRENILLGNEFTLYEDTTYTEATYSETVSWEESSTTYDTVTSTTEGEIPTDVRNDIDNDIDEENQEASRRGSEEAEEEARRQQDLEDANADKINQEIAQEQQQLQDDINTANDKIDQNNSDIDPSNNISVNEDDFSSNVDFDDEYSDENGNLDDSVQNITTDPSGAYEPLPNPEDTENAFEERNYINNTAKVSYDDLIEYIDVDNGQAYIEYDEQYISYDEDGNPIVSSKEYSYNRNRR